jgi:hypothetical protein
VTSELEHLVRQHLTDWRTGWSMGTFGAIAEFHQDRDEATVVDSSRNLTRATRRGAIHVDHRKLAEVRAVAYETMSPKRHRWSQAVSLCLPNKAARRSMRSALAELGPDDEAIRGIDRTGILFDMGLSLPQCDFCIRTSDPKLLAALRASLGHSLFEHDNFAMTAILTAHPHRVAVTNIGRIEVYQKIGGPATGGISPAGPHTHLLPKLLKSGRTHSANVPIPDGLVPLGSMHPGNPVVGPMGEDVPFDRDLHRDFQMLLGSYGNPEIVAAKRRVLDALENGGAPEAFDMPANRFERAAVRLALRQRARLADSVQDWGLRRTVMAWQKIHDQNGETESEEDDAPEH